MKNKNVPPRASQPLRRESAAALTCLFVVGCGGAPSVGDEGTDEQENVAAAQSNDSPRKQNGPNPDKPPARIVDDTTTAMPPGECVPVRMKKTPCDN